MEDKTQCVHCLDKVELLTEKEMGEHYRDCHKNFRKKCKTCFIRFRKDQHLTLHRRIEHGMEAGQIDLITCLECNQRKFPTIKALTDHYDAVHSRLTYGCRVCGNRFASIADLEEHERLSRGVEGM